MQSTLHTLIMNLVWIVAACITATVIFRKVAPYLWGQCKGETIGQHIERIHREQKEKHDFQFNLNMPPRRALRVRTTNVAVLLGFMCFGAYVAPKIGHEFMSSSVLCFGAYIAIGLIACSLARVVPAELFTGLNWNSRIDVRLYYVWLWPLHVIKTMRLKRRA
ncbi:hypothetical protein [Paraburkholderia humisilvae]|uniref:Uncharacterized protein n=1 Tax=Paraburkholderia humisilvae TaxID=627669 RepID=A0A6J5FC77_9BURK|nr:hypothetical protein [Paraburkholderia humisilvae]CAB3775057.1 hypothetical protein LMG29542_08439 [Paraburkholderia humisilvae]